VRNSRSPNQALTQANRQHREIPSAVAAKRGKAYGAELE
jgi:hypothetical protein